jgi:hypothetical protein
VKTFVANKLDDLAAYDNVKEEAEHSKALMDSEEITAENFICRVLSLLDSGR